MVKGSCQQSGGHAFRELSLDVPRQLPGITAAINADNGPVRKAVCAAGERIVSGLIPPASAFVAPDSEEDSRGFIPVVSAEFVRDVPLD